MVKTSFFKKVFAFVSVLCFLSTTLMTTPSIALTAAPQKNLRQEVEDLMAARKASTSPEVKRAIEDALETKLRFKNENIETRIVFDDKGATVLMKALNEQGVQEVAALRSRLQMHVDRHRSDDQIYEGIWDGDGGWFSWVTEIGEYVVAYVTGGVVTVVVTAVMDHFDVQLKDAFNDPT